MPKGIRLGTVEDLQNRYPTAILIKNWKELEEYAKKNESKTHVIVMSEHGCSASIEPLDDDVRTSDKYYDHYHYLSTHAFDYFIDSTKALQKRGFNVILDDWNK